MEEVLVLFQNHTDHMNKLDEIILTLATRESLNTLIDDVNGMEERLLKEMRNVSSNFGELDFHMTKQIKGLREQVEKSNLI